jgi:hemolysin III
MAPGDDNELLARAEEVAGRVVDAVKPKLRGWLHTATFPLATAGGIVLVCLAPTGKARLAAAVYAVTAALLFGVSAVYHRGRWSPRVHGVLKRMDHANIFLIIAGTYTPFAALLLEKHGGTALLWIVWVGALLGVVFRVLWVEAPRWLYTPVYLALGWVAVFYLPDILRTGGVALLVLISVGGLLYSLGGVVYAAKRPDPSPRWFGFHEVFHALTLAAFAVHYIAVSFVTYRHG